MLGKVFCPYAALPLAVPRFACSKAYSFAFAALHQLRESKAGVGVRLAAEAVSFRVHAERLGSEYDRAAIGGPKGKKAAPVAAGRKAFQEDLDREVGHFPLKSTLLLTSHHHMSLCEGGQPYLCFS
jgi:hypothetical protein